MDSELLVDSQIDDGRKIAELLVNNGFNLSVAFWAQTSEDNPWYYYIASPFADKEHMNKSYKVIYDCLDEVSSPFVSPSEIRLLNEKDAIARAAIEERTYRPSATGTRFRGRWLGGIPIKNAYIYPEFASRFFFDIKRQFPSAEYFTIEINGRGQQTFDLLRELGPYAGKINSSEFEGKAPGTVMFAGPRVYSVGPTAVLGFVYRPEGWNKVFREATRTWEEVRLAATNEPLYEEVDFSPIAALKSTAAV
jgi:hypothetical protein